MKRVNCNVEPHDYATFRIPIGRFGSSATDRRIPRPRLARRSDAETLAPVPTLFEFFTLSLVFIGKFLSISSQPASEPIRENSGSLSARNSAVDRIKVYLASGKPFPWNDRGVRPLKFRATETSNLASESVKFSPILSSCFVLYSLL